MLEEFKKFAFKGNMIDIAVGVIIGGAFGKIVSSLVNDIIMPPIGVLLGKVDFTNLKYVIIKANSTTAEVSLKYGSFIQTVVDFLIVAASVFIFIKLLDKGRAMLTKKEREADEKVKAEGTSVSEPAKSTVTEELLTEIRDLLKTGK